MSDVALKFGATDDGLSAQFSKVNKQLDALKSNSEKVASAIDSTFKSIKSIGAAAAVLATVKELVSFADNLVKVSAQTGIAIGKVQQLSFIADQADVAFESLTSGISRMQRALVSADEGQKGAAESLQQLGIDAKAFFQLSPDEQFRQVAVAVSAIEDPAIKADRVMDLLGKGGAELIPVLDEVGKNFGKLNDQFLSIGGPVGDDAIHAVDDLGDTFGATVVAAKSLGVEILASIGPEVQFVLKTFNALLGDTRDLLSGRDGDPTDFTFKPKMKGDASTALQAILGGRLEVPLEIPKLDIPNPLPPGGLVFEESDEGRAARQKRLAEQMGDVGDAREAVQDRLDKLLEEDAKRRDKALDEDIERTTGAELEKLQIKTDAMRFEEQLRETFNLRAIELEEIKNQSIFEIASGLFMDLARENSKFAKLQQGIALAQTIYSTAAGIMKAFQTLPWPASIIAAGKVAVTGAMQVAKIKATNYNSGGGSAPSVAGGSISSASERALPAESMQSADTRGQTTIYLQGYITRDLVGEMIDAIRDEMGRDVIVIPTNSLQAQVIRKPA